MYKQWLIHLPISLSFDRSCLLSTTTHVKIKQAVLIFVIDTIDGRGLKY